MRPIALDTNTYAGFKRGDARCVEVVQRADQLLLSSTVAAELLAGFACGSQEARNREELSRFLASPRVALCDSSLTTADHYALIYRDLRRSGKPIPTNDIWIAASCLERGALLFTFDQHFEQIAGLRVIRSWAEALP
ncbi:MAG: type II toxin-antitoxin system VapC family toxin [Cyanobacteria bacterium K_DeepCast_150m_m2_101]|nr:type II toxin-antitoxin system VapC family toxin [Cyanobacteria bacterium K_DeepCast_150m_m2_101]